MYRSNKGLKWPLSSWFSQKWFVILPAMKFLCENCHNNLRYQTYVTKRPIGLWKHPYWSYQACMYTCIWPVFLSYEVVLTPCVFLPELYGRCSTHSALMDQVFSTGCINKGQVQICLGESKGFFFFPSRKKEKKGWIMYGLWETSLQFILNPWLSLKLIGAGDAIVVIGQYGLMPNDTLLIM